LREAGVGKTALVQHAVSGSTPSTLLLSGASPAAVDQRAAAAAPSRISRTLLVHGGPRPWPLDGLEAIDKPPFAAGCLVHDVASVAPVVLLIDGLQWADEGTLDVLTYLVAARSRPFQPECQRELNHPDFN
jgi:hypothetical protein